MKYIAEVEYCRKLNRKDTKPRMGKAKRVDITIDVMCRTLGIPNDVFYGDRVSLFKDHYSRTESFKRDLGKYREGLANKYFSDTIRKDVIYGKRYYIQASSRLSE